MRVGGDGREVIVEELVGEHSLTVAGVSAIAQVRVASEQVVAVTEGVIDRVVESRAEGTLTGVEIEMIRNAGAVNERAVERIVLRAPGAEVQELPHRWIEAALWNTIARERRSRVTSIRQLGQGRRIENGIADSAEAEVAREHCRRGYRADAAEGLLGVLPLEACQKKRAVTAVVNLRQDHRTVEGARHEMVTKRAGSDAGLLPSAVQHFLAHVAFLGKAVKLIAAALESNV